IFESDKDDYDVMNRKPRSIDAKLFDLPTILKCFFQGGLTLSVTIAIYIFIRNDHSTETARALAFLTLVVCNLGMILSNRSLTRSSIQMIKEKNEAFKWVMSGTTIMLILVMVVPFLKSMFRFGSVSLADLLLALSGGIFAVILMDLLKTIPLLKKLRIH
ncbi:MAG: cation-translocating P-type ATPase C-terminal domain-containing protein, partial [Bacteroidota bacterium]|nr:cation-translocating P-type ATPase C-terminal domain-containing protein [Bacteroidota bacterium]